MTSYCVPNLQSDVGVGVYLHNFRRVFYSHGHVVLLAKLSVDISGNETALANACLSTLLPCGPSTIILKFIYSYISMVPLIYLALLEIIILVPIIPSCEHSK